MKNKRVMNLVESVLCEEGCEFYKGRNEKGYIVCEKYGVLLNCPWNLMHQQKSEKGLIKFWNDVYTLIMPPTLKITSHPGKPKEKRRTGKVYAKMESHTR